MSQERLCHEMGASELTQAFRSGALSLQAFYDALQQYGAAVEPEVQAFAHQSSEVVEAQRWVLEDMARAEGLACIRLETGEALFAAVALYTDMGYQVCGPFGDYAAHPASLFMEKSLIPAG